MTLNLLKAVLLVQIFFSIGITLFAYGLPDDKIDYLESYQDLSSEINIETIRDEMQSGLDSSLNIPVIELGALIFYSGNIIIDLMLNFAFAIPEMLGLLIAGFSTLFSIDTFVMATVQLLSGVLVTILYFLGLLQLLSNIRSGQRIT